jgi:predicted NBD/HSP70 family sugar kinase
MSLGVDVGGSHVTASVIGPGDAEKGSGRLVRREIDGHSSAFNIVEAIAGCIKEAGRGGTAVSEVGIAFPGPFDYENGVSTIRNVGGKFEQTFGLHLKQALKDATGLENALFLFSNDAHCFAAGACRRYGLQDKKVVFLTLGTGFGSAWMVNGKLATDHPSLPASGAFYNEPFGEGTADDYFSTRWFHRAHREATGNEIADVGELAGMNTEISQRVFNEFGTNLGSFLLPWLEKFECDELVIGGNISKANRLFVSALKNQLDRLKVGLTITFCADTEECILAGAAHLAKQDNENARNHNEYNYEASRYDIDALAKELSLERTAVIDGDGVTSWEAIRSALHLALQQNGKRVFWYDINACLNAGRQCCSTPAENTDQVLSLFDEQKIKMLRPDPAVDLCIVYGTCAALSNWEGKSVKLALAQKEKPAVL